jgi:hypothetical protein
LSPELSVGREEERRGRVSADQLIVVRYHPASLIAQQRTNYTVQLDHAYMYGDGVDDRHDGYDRVRGATVLESLTAAGQEHEADPADPQHLSFFVWNHKPVSFELVSIAIAFPRPWIRIGFISHFSRLQNLLLMISCKSLLS